MEKFGIFELLDALSAIALDKEEPAPPVRAKGDDPVYRPPAYGQTESEDQGDTPSDPPAPPQKTGEYALDEFYRMHDSRAKK